MSKATAIVNARVFDGTRLRDWTSVRFADGIITDCATGPTAQDGDEVIDAGGGTILPGLIQHGVRKRREITGTNRVERTRGRAAQLGIGRPASNQRTREFAGQRPSFSP